MRLDRARFGASAARNMPKTTRFHAFSRFSDQANICLVLVFFPKCCENHAFSRVFRASGPGFHASFFIVFARSSNMCQKHCAQFGSPEAHFRHFLSLSAASMASFWGFGGPLPFFPTHFCNKIRKRLAHFLRFLADMPQTTCFHIFSRISP